jgi:hypothetical protein
MIIGHFLSFNLGPKFYGNVIVLFRFSTENGEGNFVQEI